MPEAKRYTRKTMLKIGKAFNDGMGYEGEDKRRFRARKSMDDQEMFDHLYATISQAANDDIESERMQACDAIVCEFVVEHGMFDEYTDEELEEEFEDEENEPDEEEEEEPEGDEEYEEEEDPEPDEPDDVEDDPVDESPVDDDPKIQAIDADIDEVINRAGKALNDLRSAEDAAKRIAEGLEKLLMAAGGATVQYHDDAEAPIEEVDEEEVDAVADEGDYDADMAVAEDDAKAKTKRVFKQNKTVPQLQKFCKVNGIKSSATSIAGLKIAIRKHILAEARAAVDAQYEEA